MIVVWIIVAVGVFIFLAEVGEGIKNYLTNKEHSDGEKQSEVGTESRS